MAHEADPARKAAVAALVRVHRGGWANMAAKGALAGPFPTGRDKAFAGALFFGAAERLYTLDFLLAPFLKRPPAGLDAEVRAILEAGLYQMLWMKVPPSAAVNESVKLAAAMKKSSATGLVNAVLRRAADAYSSGAQQAGIGAALEKFSFADETARLCARYSVSPAVAGAVTRALPGEQEAFLRASFSTGEICIRANTLKTDAAALAARLAEQGAQVRPGALPACLYMRRPGGVAGDALFDEGLYHVQGEASQYACAALGVWPGQRVLDVCAAPGGKSATLAQQMAGRGTLVAGDIHPRRVELIRETAARLGLEGVLQAVQSDAAGYTPALEGQHRVLCDVPCSGLGVLAQKPDMRLANGDGFDALPALQLKILTASARYLVKGGALVYSTCTVRPEENAGVVRAFMACSRGYRLVAPGGALADGTALPPAPEGAMVCDDMVTILPHRTGLDGFFVATLERI